MEYDYDVPLPSIETEHTLTATGRSATTNTTPAETSHGATLQSAAETPLPPSSPTRSPRQTARLQHHGYAPHHAAPSPARGPSWSSPLNPDRRSSTPLLQTKKSTSSLKRGETPLRQLSSRQSSPSLSSSASASATVPQASERTGPNIDKTPPPTAASVARDYWQKEMRHHESADCDPQTVVLIHDSCYGHRYSRPRTSKSLLSTIVERPERIHASILGLSTAYVRMGGRHAGGRAPPHPDRDPRRGSAVPFKIGKTARSVPLHSAAATHVHGQKWMEELQIMCDAAEGKLALNGKELVRSVGYGKDENGHPLPKLHEGDLYLAPESRRALEGCLGGVCDAVDAVFRPGRTRRAFVCIRPPGHHCASNYPSGFCWINNVHVAITHAAINHGLTHAAIIDFDLHHGDGSQMVAWEHNRKACTLPKNAAPHKKTHIGYFSLHDINSYPCEMGDEDKVRNASVCVENAHGQSIWNVHLEPWKTYPDFWHLYETKYTVLIDKTRSFLRHHTERMRHSGMNAKAAIFLSAGFDASEWEGEGMQRHKVNVPTDFYARFTADVVRVAEEEGLGADGRVISVLEGGYSDRALTSGVLSHVCGLAYDPQHAEKPESSRGDGLSTEMSNKLGLLTVDDRASASDGPRPDAPSQLDAEWWNLANLEWLEALVNPPPAPPASTKGKDKSGNYSSPTQASTAKMADQARVRRSLSGQLERLASQEAKPVPPPPEVDWATAAYELSRLLIPTDRQTRSCTYDELNADAPRVRRDRPSTVGLPAHGEPRMQLRDRKAKPSDDEVTKPFNRRKTIAAGGELPDLADGPGDAKSTTRSRRRSSGTSSVLAGFQNMQISDPAPSSRASSVMSEIPQIAVRKPRMAAAAKVSRRAGGTAPPVPRVPSAVYRENIGQAAAPHAPDVVTDGLEPWKKMTIKLKVPSPEENAAREKKAAEALVKKPRPRKPAFPKAPKATPATNQTSSAASVEPIGDRDGESGPQGIMSTDGAAVAANDAPGAARLSENMIEPPGDVPAAVPVVWAQPTSLVDVQQSGIGHHHALSAAETTMIDADTHPALEATTDLETGVSSTPASAKRRRADLPVFTSSSPIPFGRSVPGKLNENWHAPPSQDTYQPVAWQGSRALPTDPRTTSPGQPASVGADGQLRIGSDASEASGPSGASESSLWDVPATPQR